MKKFIFASFVALFVAATCGRAQMGTTPNGAPPSSTDDAVAAMSTIKRPSHTPAPASASGPKKPLEANLTKDEKSDSSTTEFSASTPKIYLKWSDDSATKGEKLRVVWSSEAGGASAKSKTLHEGSGTLPGPGSFGSFYLAEPSGGFPVGKYRVDLYEDSKLVKTLKFTITK